MRVLLLTDGIHPYVIGGMQKHSTMLLKQLLIQGHTVKLLHCFPKSKQLLPTKNIIHNLFCNEVVERFNLKSKALYFPEFPKFPGHYLLESWVYSKRVWKEIKGQMNEFDLIYIQGFAGWKTLRKQNKEMPLTWINFHGLNMFQKSFGLRNKLESAILRIIVRRNIKKADKCISLGGKLNNILVDLVGIDKVLVQPLGLEAKWIINDPIIKKEIRFLFVGRPDKVKGIDRLYKALDMCNIRGIPAQIDFVGDFNENEKYFSKSNVEARYHGLVQDEFDLMRIYDSCSVLILPSYSEGMPNVILEAMARGLAVIATDVGAVGNLVSQQNGILLESNKPEIISNALLEAFNWSKLEILEKSNASIQLAKTMTWEKVIRELTLH